MTNKYTIDKLKEVDQCLKRIGVELQAIRAARTVLRRHIGQQSRQIAGKTGRAMRRSRLSS